MSNSHKDAHKSLNRSKRKQKKAMDRKEQNRNQTLTIRKTKRDEQLFSTRREVKPLESTVLHKTVLESPPLVVCVVPLNVKTKVQSFLDGLKKCYKKADVSESPQGILHIRSSEHKLRLSFVCPEVNNYFNLLDTMNVADRAVFLCSKLVDKWGNKVLSYAQTQKWLKPVYVALIEPNKNKTILCVGTDKIRTSKIFYFIKKREEITKLFQKIKDSNSNDTNQQEIQPHLITDHVEYEPDMNGDVGKLKVSGYLKGSYINVNGLVHISGLGDYQMCRIDAYDDPYPSKENKSDNIPAESVKMSQKSDPTKQVSCVSENILAELTWPTKDDEEDENIESMPSEDDNSEAVSADMEDDAAEKFDATVDWFKLHEIMKKPRWADQKELCPDAVDMPYNKPARERFARYRNLESFESSPWDPKESLPEDYARIFRCANYDVTRRRIYKENENNLNNMHGLYVTLHVTGVRHKLWDKFRSSNGNTPLAVFAVLPYERKMTVMNVLLSRTKESNEPIKSKERLIFQLAHRRIIVNPVFSEHTTGTKFKYKRFFQPASTCVASFYAPLQFLSSPILCFKEKENTELQLVASGSLLSCDPDRLIIKKIVLLGYPYEVNKRSAIIKMFYNSDDVLNYKGCKVVTKYGHSGHIKKPLGTHGLMECTFDGNLECEDTVMLNLYKRVFPKLNNESFIIEDSKEC